MSMQFSVVGIANGSLVWRFWGRVIILSESLQVFLLLEYDLQIVYDFIQMNNKREENQTKPHMNS